MNNLILLPSLQYREELRFYNRDKQGRLTPPSGETLPYAAERKLIEQRKQLDARQLQALLAEKLENYTQAERATVKTHYLSEYHIIAKALQEKQWPDLFPAA